MNNMGRLLRWFYCLPVGQAALLMALAAAVFHLVKCRWGEYRLFRPLCAAVFAVWLGAMVYTTLGSREAADREILSLVPFHSYREVLAGGNIEILRSNFMNAALFFPGGILLGALLSRQWPGWCRVLLGTVLLAALSAGVEYVQFTRALGWVEIDDVLHNTLGALLGLLAGTPKKRKE